MSVSLVKRPKVSLVKSMGRHAARCLRPSVVVAPALVGNANPCVFRNGELVAAAWSARGNGPRHLCAGFDMDTLVCESRCRAAVTDDCSCVVRGSRSGHWTRQDGSRVAA